MSDFDALLFERDLEELLGGDAPPAQLGDEIAATIRKAAEGVAAAPRRRRRARASRWTPAPGALSLALAAALLGGLALVLITREAPGDRVPGTATAPEDAADAPPRREDTDRPRGGAPQRPPLVADPQPDLDTDEAPDSLPPDPSPGEDPDDPPLGPPAADRPDAIPPEPSPAAPSERQEPGAGPAVARAPHSTARALVGTLLAYTRRAGLRSRNGPDDPWTEPDGESLRSGVHLRAKRPVDVSLVGGGVLRFVGEVAIQAFDGAEPSKGGGLTVSLRKRSTQAFVDAIGVAAPRRISLGDLMCEVTQACALVTHLGRLQEVLCFAGEVRSGAATLQAGSRAKLSVKGFSKSKRLSKKDRGGGILANLAPRVLWREAFEGDLGSRLSQGRQEGGQARCEGDGSRITVSFEEPVPALQGGRLRLRYLASNAGALYLQLTHVDGRAQFGKWIPLAPKVAWVELDLSLSELVRDDGGERALSPGDELQNIQVIVQDGERASLRVEWIELIRVHE